MPKTRSWIKTLTLILIISIGVSRYIQYRADSKIFAFRNALTESERVGIAVIDYELSGAPDRTLVVFKDGSVKLMTKPSDGKTIRLAEFRSGAIVIGRYSLTGYNERLLHSIARIVPPNDTAYAWHAIKFIGQEWK